MGGRATGGRPGGARTVSPLRTGPARLGLAGLSLALALGLALGLGLSAPRLWELLVAAGLGAVALIALALAGHSRLAPWAQGLLAGEYIGWLEVRGGPVDARAPLVAAGLLAVGELVAWSLDARRQTEAPAHVARAIRLGLLLLVGTGLAVLPLVAAGLQSAGLLPVVAASAAVLAITGWATVLVWRHRVRGR